MFIKKYLIVIISFVLVNNIWGQVGVNKLGQSTMNFLLVSTSAKASGMGDAYTAVGAGAESIFYNPAGITETDNDFNVIFNYTQWIADIKYLSGGVVWNLGNYGSVGLSMLTVDYGTIYGTSFDQTSNSVLGYIDNGIVNNVGAYAFGLSYGKKISDQFLIGGNVRYVGQNLGENKFVDGTSRQNNAQKFTFDIGVKYYTGFKSFRFGMIIRNFSTDLKREEFSEQLPLLFTMGMAFDLMDFIIPDHSPDNSFTIAVDFVHPNNYSERVDLGADYKLLGMLSLRGGYQTNSDISSWSAGVGINTSLAGYNAEVNYSYSYITESAFKSVSRLSIAFSF